MPSKESHLAAAKRNQETIDYLLSGDDTHLAWAVTVGFYKGLHVVEAILAGDPESPCKHTDDHRMRNDTLKHTHRYKQLWKMYRPLLEASLVARYLQVEPTAGVYDKFSDYMDRAAVEGLMMGHYLVQLEKSAGKFLNVDDIYA